MLSICHMLAPVLGAPDAVLIYPSHNPTWAEKAFGETQHQSWLKKKKTLSKLGKEGNFLNLIKNFQKKTYNSPHT